MSDEWRLRGPDRYEPRYEPGRSGANGHTDRLTWPDLPEYHPFQASAEAYGLDPARAVPPPRPRLPPAINPATFVRPPEGRGPRSALPGPAAGAPPRLPATPPRALPPVPRLPRAPVRPPVPQRPPMPPGPSTPSGVDGPGTPPPAAP